MSVTMDSRSPWGSQDGTAYKSSEKQDLNSDGGMVGTPNPEQFVCCLQAPPSGVDISEPSVTS